MKNYLIKITAYATVVVVGAESEDKAMQYAIDEISKGDFETDEISVDRELRPGQETENAKRHAQAVALPD